MGQRAAKQRHNPCPWSYEIKSMLTLYLNTVIDLSMVNSYKRLTKPYSVAKTFSIDKRIRLYLQAHNLDKINQKFIKKMYLL